MIRGDRRRGALIDVRRPHVEGDGGGLEAEPHDEHGEPDHEQGGQMEIPRGEIAGDLPDVEDARRGIDQRHAVEQKGRGKGPQEEVFERGLRRPGVAAQTARRGRRWRWT